MATAPIDLADSTQVSLDLQRLLGRASLIGSARAAQPDPVSGEPRISFSTLLLALHISEDPVSLWQQGYASSKGINWHAILSDKGISSEALEEARSERTPERYLQADPSVTISIAALLEQARRLQQGMGSAGPLDIRHVLAAYAFAPGSAHEGELKRWGFDRAAWAAALLGALPSLVPQLLVTELPALRQCYENAFGELPREVPAYPPPPVLRLPRYSPDEPSGSSDDDYLDVRPDVNALAAVIAARETHPPLAIGIFGDWGSGKTFFMRSLRRRIDELTYAARGGPTPEQEQRQADITFFKYIVQVEFNAWHYSEGNLWASIVEHLFTNLRIAQDPAWQPDGFDEEKLRKEMLDEIQVAKVALDAETTRMAALEEQLRLAEEQLKELRETRKERTQQLADLTLADVLKRQDFTEVSSAIIKALRAAGFDNLAGKLEPGGELATDFQTLRQSVTQAKATLQSGGKFLAPLLQRGSGPWKRILLLVLAVAAGPLIGLLAWGVALALGSALDLGSVRTLLAQVGGLTTAAAGLIGGLAAWLRHQATWTATQIGQLEAENLHLDQMQEQALADYDKEIALLQQTIIQTDAELVAVGERRADAERRIAEVTVQLEQLQPSNLLARFIRERTDSDDYRRHLGVLALVYRDFRMLSKRMEESNLALLQAIDLAAELAKREKAQCLNRIVLYIDDLDRCPPNRVVEVLQAIHLLLSLPLFVVVVGVDARWVSEALARRYPHLLNADALSVEVDGDLDFGRGATPHDYLEKIFQIPIWLKPLSVSTSQKMLSGLTAFQIVSDPEGATATASTGAEHESPDNSPPSQADLIDRADTTAIVAPLPPGIELNPASLQLYQKELRCMMDLAPILGRSPRAMKRYVNLYRLLKVTLDEAGDPLSFETQHNVADYQVALFLLAVVTGLPAISRSLFHALHELNSLVETAVPAAASTLDTMLAIIRKTPGRSAQTDLKRVEQWLNDYAGGQWRMLPVEPFARRAVQVARFSFRAEQVYV